MSCVTKESKGSEIENLNEYGDDQQLVITKNRNHLHFAQNVKPSERNSGSSLTLQKSVSDKDTNEIHLLHGDEKLLNLSQPEKIYSKHLKKGSHYKTVFHSFSVIHDLLLVHTEI